MMASARSQEKKIVRNKTRMLTDRAAVKPDIRWGMATDIILESGSMTDPVQYSDFYLIHQVIEDKKKTSTAAAVLVFFLMYLNSGCTIPPFSPDGIF